MPGNKTLDELLAEAIEKGEMTEAERDAFLHELENDN